jgi:hypothetical protein
MRWSPAGARRSDSKKCEQVPVHLIFQRRAQSVRGAFVDRAEKPVARAADFS